MSLSIQKANQVPFAPNFTGWVHLILQKYEKFVGPTKKNAAPS
jgi:hypothetical protein